MEPVQVIPSYEYAIELVPPPPATQIDPLNPIALHKTVNIALPEVDGVQVIPLFLEYTRVLVPEPPATIKDPLTVIQFHDVENIVEPVSVHLIPSKEDKSRGPDPEVPPARNIEPVHAVVSHE